MGVDRRGSSRGEGCGGCLKTTQPAVVPPLPARAGMASTHLVQWASILTGAAVELVQDLLLTPAGARGSRGQEVAGTQIKWNSNSAGHIRQ